MNTEPRITIYEDDKITIKTQKQVGTGFYYRTQEDRKVWTQFTDNVIDEETAKTIAPMLKMIFERVYNYGHSQGYQAGIVDGIEKVQKRFEKLFDKEWVLC